MHFARDFYLRCKWKIILNKFFWIVYCARQIPNSENKENGSLVLFSIAYASTEPGTSSCVSKLSNFYDDISFFVDSSFRRELLLLSRYGLRSKKNKILQLTDRACLSGATKLFSRMCLKDQCFRYSKLHQSNGEMICEFQRNANKYW